MRIITICRTKNEAKNIERFCHSYSQFSDLILIADGGSTDNTKQLAEQFDKVRIKDYEDRVTINNRTFNPENAHINFLIDWAKDEQADWIFIDDCDSVPNYLLRRDIKSHLYLTGKAQISAFHVYLWDDGNMWFPDMNNNGHPDWTHVWAWQPHLLNIKGDTTRLFVHLENTARDKDKLIEAFPNCLLHYSWNQDTIKKKVENYNIIGLPMIEPMIAEAYGQPKPIEPWMRLNE